MRFERLIEGIQAFEKIHLLKEEFKRKNNRQGLNQIHKILKTFDEFGLETRPAAEVVKKAKETINHY
nr:DUF4091 domain-containing protein [Bacteroides fragilis]